MYNIQDRVTSRAGDLYGVWCMVYGVASIVQLQAIQLHGNKARSNYWLLADAYAFVKKCLICLVRNARTREGAFLCESTAARKY